MTNKYAEIVSMRKFIEIILIDSRYAWSRFVAQPITSLIIVMTLALSIGATTAIFSVVNGLMFQATPFKDSKQLVILQQKDLQQGQVYGFSASELIDYQVQSSTVTDISEYHSMTFTMYGHGDPVRAQTGVVSSNFFSMLNLKPILGRTFTEDEDDYGAEPLVLLTYEFWQREFNGQNDVINQSVEFNNRSHRIIGVLPHFPQFPDVNDIYMAIPSCPWRSSENAISNRSMRMMTSFAKMKAESSLFEVNKDLSTIAKQLNSSYPEAYANTVEFSAQALSLHDELVRTSRPYLYTLLATTLLLFLIASANVTNLTFSQQAKRKREFAVRSSLGASKARIAQLLLTESLILALFGGGIGLLFAYLGLDFLRDFAANFSHLASEITIDTTVMLFALAVSVLAGIISGLAPSFTKVNLVSALKEGGKSSYSTDNAALRNGLLICQFALSLTLLIAATLTIKSLNNLQTTDTGFTASNVQISQIDLNWSVYQNAQQRWQISQQIVAEVRKLPYVDSAALSMTYPTDTVAINFGSVRQAIKLDDREVGVDDILPSTWLRSASDGYFETINASIAHGRSFDKNDDAQAPFVVVINQSLAAHWWPNQIAINHRISLDNGGNWLTIIGVVDDILERGAFVEPGFQIYRSMAQFPIGHIAILAKNKNTQAQNITTADVNRFNNDIKELVAELDARQSLSKFESLQQAVDNSIALQRFLAQLLTIFSAIALFITISGVSGVMSYMVNLRTREIGIRMAIGADKSKVLVLILFYGIKLTSIGLFIGLLCAYYSGTLLSEQLFDINAFDAITYLTAMLVIFTISIFACLVPAWRASSIAPMRALKSQ